MYATLLALRRNNADAHSRETAMAGLAPKKRIDLAEVNGACELYLTMATQTREEA
jgi:hypothetical protein